MFWYVIAVLSSALGGVVLVWTVLDAQSAPQQAAGAAVAVALAVIPYVFARCVELAFARRREDARHRELLQALDAKPRVIVGPPKGLS